ncbi:MAG: TetR/AcrR family transcriptional regulator, partial [Lachnospiraceae bacterium]|nr:TetR/AcrR family transcriptional regulator [Lachnospiraceae bacterium]
MAERRDVVRMRDTIEKAFFKLSMENQNRITVKDVLEEANISRGTFYAYYKDIPDLEQNMVRRIVMICREKTKAALENGIITDVRSQIDFF